MKELKPKRAVFQALVAAANTGIEIVCLCSTQKHIKAFAGAIVKVVFEENIVPWNVTHTSIVTVITVHASTITLIQPESYDASNFTDNHKAVTFI